MRIGKRNSFTRALFVIVAVLTVVGFVTAATADSITLRMIRAPFFGMNRNVFIADSTA